MKKASLKRKLKKVPGFFKRLKLKNRNFSIISNNCWGGMVYDNFDLPYYSPTIGLFFMSDDYIKFLRNIRYYLKGKLNQVSWRDTPFSEFLYMNKDQYKKSLGKSLDDLIICKLYDIYIVFLHYDSFDEACQKWYRRSKRVNFDNLVVKFNDQNNFSKDNFESFDALPYTNKIFYTANDSLVSSNKLTDTVIYLPQYKKYGCVLNDMEIYKQNFNLTGYLNYIKPNTK